MANATLTRGGTSIDIPLHEEGGEQLVATSFGKPETTIRESGGTLSPRVNDRWSGLQSFTLLGKVYDYQTAHDLADLIKSASTTPLELSIPSDVYDDPITVAPAAGQDTALSVSFPAGKRNVVDVELTLTRVGDVVGIGDQQATTPTATGSGPIEVTVGGTTIEVPTAGLSLERTVGRPNDAVRRDLGPDPRYEVKRKVTSDVFTFAFDSVANIQPTLNTIRDEIFRTNLGRGGFEIDMNGVLGLGAFEAVTTGSSPFRQVHQAGRDWVNVPVFEARRIFQPEV